MTTTFQSVNLTLGPRDPAGTDDVPSPSTPRGPIELVSRPPPVPIRDERDEGEARTPTRNSFSSFAAANGKRALPVSPFSSTFPESQVPGRDEPADDSRTDSKRSSQTFTQGSQDIDMDRSEDGDDASDAESVDDESGRPSKKKKKGQRFYCTEYPPCNLSFTRSEHLARHIRKHTGERPFQCHCARRFSRLDNLRQHAQTVHVNEEIPGDSLAATGTRFQRQIRTDRVRPPGRSRASTGTGPPHGRGHARNLSTSSIASTASNVSTMSSISTLSQEPGQRRPHSLTMIPPQAQRTGLSIDTLRASPQAPYTFGHRSPADANTPTSTNHAHTPSSPMSSTLGSPVSIARHPGPWGERPPSRRLSVPSGTNPFLAHGAVHGPMHNPLHPTNSSLQVAPPSLHPSNPSLHSSNNSSLATSPTSSVYTFGKDTAAAEAEWRRRTWHSYNQYQYPRPATSGLTFSQTPDAPRPAFAPLAVAAAGQPQQRLPGFETFDQISKRPETPTRPGTNDSSQPVTPQRPGLASTGSDRSIPGPGDRRGHASWDLSLHQNLTKLDIANGTPPKEPFMWPRPDVAPFQPTSQPLPTQPPPVAHSTMQSTTPQPPRAPNQVPSDASRIGQANGTPQGQPQGQPKAQPHTPARAKRNGWYHGPLASAQPHAPAPLQAPMHAIGQRRSPEDSSSSDGVHTPSSASMDYQPTNIVHANGYVETQPAPTKPITNFSHPFHSHNTNPTSQPANRVIPAPRKSDLRGLDALVAAAESEGKAADPMQPR